MQPSSDPTAAGHASPIQYEIPTPQATRAGHWTLGARRRNGKINQGEGMLFERLRRWPKLHKKGRGSFALCPFTSRSPHPPFTPVPPRLQGVLSTVSIRFSACSYVPSSRSRRRCSSHSLKSQRSLPSRSLVSLRQSPVTPSPTSTKS